MHIYHCSQSLLKWFISSCFKLGSIFVRPKPEIDLLLSYSTYKRGLTDHSFIGSFCDPSVIPHHQSRAQPQEKIKTAFILLTDSQIGLRYLFLFVVVTESSWGNMWVWLWFLMETANGIYSPNADRNRGNDASFSTTWNQRWRNDLWCACLIQTMVQITVSFQAWMHQKKKENAAEFIKDRCNHNTTKDLNCVLFENYLNTPDALKDLYMPGSLELKVERQDESTALGRGFLLFVFFFE